MMYETLQQLDNFSASFNNHINSKQSSYEHNHVLLIDIRPADKKQLNTALIKLGCIPVEINNTNNNTSRILDIKNEMITNSCLIIVDAKSHVQKLLNSVNEAQNALFSQPRLHRPILSLADAKNNKHELFTLGVFDYISCPLISQELIVRIKYAINYFEDAQACLDDATLPNNSCLQAVVSPLIQTKAIALAKNTAEYLQTKLCEEIKLSELIVKMGTNRNKLNDAFKTTYGITVFAWLHEQRMALARTLLETTTLSVLQVGDQVGYSDSNNFSTAFKREHKLSPKQYRQDYLRSICAPSKGFGA